MPRLSTLSVLRGGAFLLAVDSAAAGHLFPALEAATGAPPRGTSFFLTAYMLGTLLGAPMLARRAAGGRRLRVLAASLAAFSVASLVLAISSSFEVSVVARFVQGLAGSGILPLATAYVGGAVEASRRGREVAKLSLAYAIGFVVGIATVSLLLLISFRLAFVLSSLAAAVVAVLLARGAVGEPAKATPQPLGNLIPWSVALTACAYAVSTATVPTDAAPLLVRSARLLALPLLGLFVWLDRRSSAPLLPRTFFGRRVGVGTASLALVAGLGQASVVVLPTFAVVTLGVSPAASGPMLAPIVIGGFAANLLAASRLDRWGARPFVFVGAGGVVAAAALVATRGQSLFGFEAAALLLGTAVSLLSAGPLRLLAMEGGADGESEARQAVVSLLTNTGLLLGSALWGAMAVADRSPVANSRLGFVAHAMAAAAPFALGLLLLASRRTERAS